MCENRKMDTTKMKLSRKGRNGKRRRTEEPFRLRRMCRLEMNSHIEEEPSWHSTLLTRYCKYPEMFRSRTKDTSCGKTGHPVTYTQHAYLH